MTMLTPYEDRDVAQAFIRLTNAGDGLSQALGIAPVELHHGDKVHVVLECEVTRVQYDEIKDTDLLVRVHTLRAGVGTLVDGTLVADVLDKQRRAIAEAQGQHELDLDDEDGQ